MSKKVVVDLPAGTAIDKLSEADLKKMIEQAASTSGITGIDEVEVRTGNPPANTADMWQGGGPWGRWAKNC